MSEFDIGNGIATIRGTTEPPFWRRDSNVVNDNDPTITNDSFVPTLQWAGTRYGSSSIYGNYTWYIGPYWDYAPPNDVWDIWADWQTPHGAGFKVTVGTLPSGAATDYYGNSLWPYWDSNSIYDANGEGVSSPSYNIYVTLSTPDDYKSVFKFTNASQLYDWDGSQNWMCAESIGSKNASGTARFTTAHAIFKESSFMRGQEYGPYLRGETQGKVTTPGLLAGQPTWPNFNGVPNLWVAGFGVAGISPYSPTISPPPGWTLATITNNSYQAVCIVYTYSLAQPTLPEWWVSATGPIQWGTCLGVVRPFGTGRKTSRPVEALRIGPRSYPAYDLAQYSYPESSRGRTASILLPSGESAWDPDDGYSIPYGGTVETISWAENSVQTIDLHRPRLLKCEGMSWTFKASHDMDGRRFRAQKAIYKRHDYRYDEGNFGDSYLTPEQAARGWYEKEVSLVEHFDIVGGIDFALWRLSLKGMGTAIFSDGVEVADLKSVTTFEDMFTFEAGAWYTVEMLLDREREDGFWGVSFVLRKGDTVLSAHVTRVRSGTTSDPTIEGAEEWPMRVHYGLDALLFGSENLWLKGKDFLLTTQYTPGTTTQPTVSTGVTPFEAEPGVNREWVEVSDGVFSISAQPVRGSVDVYGPDGGLLAYGTQWEEADDDGISYRLIDVEADAVTVVYLVMMPEVILEPRHIRSWMQQIEAAERADDQALLA